MLTHINNLNKMSHTENQISDLIDNGLLQKEIEDRNAVYQSDEMYLPIQYKGILIEKPNFKGLGNHSILQLEELCLQYEEYCHQQQVIKQNCMQHIVELKFG